MHKPNQLRYTICFPESLRKVTFQRISAAAAAKSLQSCWTLRPHRRQPTRLPRPWDSPGKNTGMGCHFLLQCMEVKSLSRVRLFVTPWTAAFQGSSVHGICQAILAVIKFTQLQSPFCNIPDKGTPSHCMNNFNDDNKLHCWVALWIVTCSL